jgi:hypothetical protein
VTAYVGGLHNDGTVGWKKEIWHTRGYSEKRMVSHVTESILNRWTGWQMINNDIPLDNETGVNLKSHQDDTDNYSWRKVSDPIDSGRWYTKSPVREFFGAGCERKRLYNCWGWPTYLIQD